MLPSFASCYAIYSVSCHPNFFLSYHAIFLCVTSLHLLMSCRPAPIHPLSSFYMTTSVSLLHVIFSHDMISSLLLCHYIFYIVCQAVLCKNVMSLAKSCYLSFKSKVENIVVFFSVHLQTSITESRFDTLKEKLRVYDLSRKKIAPPVYPNISGFSASI